ncbi:MAG: DUF1631 family protein [Xanthomonadales bacterium]|nr:hypothetical protein [Xanthomonadales bacterium]MCC6591683.1 DUF1631 family protein [Xanthomonadales bacterium]
MSGARAWTGGAPPRLTVHGRWGADPGFALQGASERGLYLRRQPGCTTTYAEGEAVWLNWSDGEGRPLLQVLARIRQVDDSGLRLQFEPGQAQGLIEQVLALVPRRSLLDAAPDPAEQALTRIIDSIRSDFVGVWRALLESGVRGLPEDSAQTALRSAGLDPALAAQRLASAREELEADLRRRLTQSWRPTTGTPVARAAPKLADERAMQAWLTARELARTQESLCAPAWRPLRVTLQALQQMREDLHVDALAPAAVVDAMAQVLAGSGLEAVLQDQVLRAAADLRHFDLPAAYLRLGQALRRSGLQVPAIMPADPPRAGSAAATGPAARASSHPIDVRVAAPSPVPAQAWSALRRIDTPAAAGVDDRLLPGGGMIADGMLLRAAGELLGGQPPGAAAEFRERLQARARRLSGNAQAPLERRQYQALDLVARIHEALAADPLLPPGFRERCQPLLQPILALELRGEGLAELSAPLRRLLGLIEFGSVLCAGREDAAARRIAGALEEELATLARSTPWTAERIEQSCDRLDKLLQRQRAAAQAAEKRVIDACEGQQRVADTRRELRAELAGIFGGRELPQALLLLVERRLATNLLPLLLRGGVGSGAWQDWMARLRALLDDLKGAATGRTPVDPQSHLMWLRESCAGPPDEQMLARCLIHLEAALQGKRVPWVGYPDQLPQVVAEQPPEAAAGALRVGDWLSWQPPGRDPQLLKVAWRAPDGSRTVLVNRLGQKVEEAETQVPQALAGGSARIVEAGDADLAERAWRRMLISRHDELAEQATRDVLTGLPDRRELERHLQAWLLAPQRGPLLLLWLGIDHLRLVNQHHGMGTGDQLLCALAQVLRRYVDAGAAGSGYAARAAGDEFVVALHGPPEVTARRALALFDQANALEAEVDGRRLKLSLSMGMADADVACASVAQLLADAERACDAAKESGRGRWYRHQAGDARLSQMREIAHWVQRLDESLATHGLLLYGQRALALHPEQPDYVEVLLRMRGADGSIVAPADFIVAAERYGQIAAVDRFVLRELTRVLQRLSPSGGARIAFNVSARNIVDPAFVEEIVETLRQQPLPLSQLCVELTETAAIGQLDAASVGMQKLAAAGLAMVLDDFGSGWSSYQYLRQLPFDVVKVDGAFIRDIARAEQDRAMARSINEIAHLLGKRTVAEHVEDEATLEQVRAIGFDYAQGFHLGKPEPLEELLRVS